MYLNLALNKPATAIKFKPVNFFLVYPQKQPQYAYASYPAPPQAYPGPYYHGSQQYGPYNY